MNTLILNHLGQGDLRIMPDVERFDGDTVHFKRSKSFAKGTSDDYDLILLATGYKLDYPMVDREHLNWRAAAPELRSTSSRPNSTGST